MTSRTLAEQIASALVRFPSDRVAFACEEQSFTFGELVASVAQLAAGLQGLGVRSGSIVGYTLPNSAEALLLPLALWQLGACALPVFPMMPDQARCALFAGARADLVIADAATTARLAAAAAAMNASLHIVAVDACRSTSVVASQPTALPDSMPAMLAASSGTTGIPKSVLLSRGNVAASIAAAADLMWVGPWQDDVTPSCMLAFPVCTSGVMVLLGVLLSGSRVVLARDTSPSSFCRLAANWRTVSLAAPPSFFEAILAMPASSLPSLPDVRAVMTGMDFLSPTLLGRLRHRLPALEAAANGYGLVETATVFMTWKAHSVAELNGATSLLSLCPEVDNRVEVRDDEGRPVAIGGEGELWVSGPSVVSGYLGTQAELQAAFRDGWFRTGDMARWVAPGTIELRGRRKHLIKRGGKSISPIEVEERVNQTSGVELSAVVGVPHALYGQMIWAFVVPSRESPATVASIMRHCRSVLPSHMVPDRIELVGELPRGRGAGKVDRDALVRSAAVILERIGGAST